MRIHIKHQTLFSSKDKSNKKLKCRLLQLFSGRGDCDDRSAYVLRGLLVILAATKSQVKSSQVKLNLLGKSIQKLDCYQQQITQHRNYTNNNNNNNKKKKKKKKTKREQFEKESPSVVSKFFILTLMVEKQTRLKL